MRTKSAGTPMLTVAYPLLSSLAAQWCICPNIYILQ